MLLNFLHCAVLFQLGFGIGVKEKERRIPEIREEDPNMHTVFIHSDSKEAQDRYFDWKHENGELENWNIPRIVTLEKEKQHEGVKKMLETVDGRQEPRFHGRFTNQEAVVHIPDNPDDPTDSDKLDTGSQERVKEHDDGQETEPEIDTTNEEMEVVTDSSKPPKTENLNQDNNKGVNGFLVSQLESEDTHPTYIHADSYQTLQGFFDKAEKSGALANLKNPVIISSGSEILKTYNKLPLPYNKKFTTSQRLWMLNGKTNDDKNNHQSYWDFKKYTKYFGTIHEVIISTETQFEDEQLSLLNTLSPAFSTKTFTLEQEKLYTLYKDPDTYLINRVPVSSNKEQSFGKQWEQIQRKSLKHYDVNMYQYLRSDHSQEVLKGYWEQTCENFDWALNIKLNTNQNIALVCLLHDIRKRRFKYEVPPDINTEDCKRNPSSCKQEVVSQDAFVLHVEDGTGWSEEKYKNESDVYLFFPGAGSFEPLEVAYFEVEPEEDTIRFSALVEFLQPTAFLALALFGILFTVFVKCVSQAEKAQIFLFIVGGIFEQGYPFLQSIRRHTNGVLWRGFLGMRTICFLWLLAWFFFRQYLSGSLIASLSSKYVPQATHNHSKLVEFLGKKGTPLVQPMRKNEEDWVRNSYLKLVDKFPHLSKGEKITFPKNTTNLFPEMEFLECVLSKSLSEERKESCKEFQAVMGKSFAYTSTKQRLRTIKKMAQLINPDVYIYDKNVETPFMKPNFISTFDQRISMLLWNDIIYLTESGIWEKWQKQDSELEALTDCVKFVKKIRKLEDGEARRECQQLLTAAKPSRAERAFGKFEPISMRVISLPMMFFILSLCGCCAIFAFECGFFAWFKVYLAVKMWIWCLTVLRFTVRCKIVYRSLKECDLKDLIKMFHWTNVCKFIFKTIQSAWCKILNKMRNMAEWIRQVLEQLGRFLPWAREETQVIELEGVSTNIGGIGGIRSGDPAMMPSGVESAECTESNLSVHEEERIAFLLEMIEKYDRLQFPEEDMELLRKAKVIITPEEAEVLMSGFRPDEDQVQEFSPGPSRPERCAREAWVEEPGIEVNEIQDETEIPLVEQTELEGFEDDLGEKVNYPGSGSASNCWELEDI